MTFINPSYTEDIMFDESFKFINELIFNPYIDDNKFTKKNYKLACNISNDYFDTLKEDTNSYSQMRMLEEMNEKYISYRSCGYREDLKNMRVGLKTVIEKKLFEKNNSIKDKESKYLTREQIFKRNDIDKRYLGNISKEKAIDLVSKYLPFKTNKKINLEHFYKRDEVTDEIKSVSEKINKEQSTLVLGLRYDNLTEYDARYTMMVYNYILGGSTESNLFKTVREENSLCYYITSQSQPILNIGLIRSGINADDYDKVIALIYHELENMKKGNFDDSKIENAKTTYINGLTELEDNQDSVISLYEGMEYLNSDTIDNRIKNIKKVTRDDVIRVANMVHLNVIYLLEGILENEEK